MQSGSCCYTFRRDEQPTRAQPVQGNRGRSYAVWLAVEGINSANNVTCQSWEVLRAACHELMDTPRPGLALPLLRRTEGVPFPAVEWNAQGAPMQCFPFRLSPTGMDNGPSKKGIGVLTVRYFSDGNGALVVLPGNKNDDFHSSLGYAVLCQVTWSHNHESNPFWMRNMIDCIRLHLLNDLGIDGFDMLCLSRGVQAFLAMFDTNVLTPD